MSIPGDFRVKSREQVRERIEQFEALSEGWTMTDSYDGTDPMNASTFETELTRFLDRARRDGAPVAGAYDVRSPRPDEPDYTIEITEIEKRTFRPGPRN